MAEKDNSNFGISQNGIKKIDFILILFIFMLGKWTIGKIIINDQTPPGTVWIVDDESLVHDTMFNEAFVPSISATACKKSAGNKIDSKLILILGYGRPNLSEKWSLNDGGRTWRNMSNVSIGRMFCIFKTILSRFKDSDCKAIICACNWESLVLERPLTAFSTNAWIDSRGEFSMS